MTRHEMIRITAGLVLAAFVATATVASAQITQRTGAPPQTPQSSSKPAPPPAPEPSYIIGVDDVLTVVVAHQPEASGDVRVRPDGKITLSLGGSNDIVAVGLTTDQLRAKITTELERFYEKPIVTIQSKEIRSRMVFITGPVNKPGAYPLTGPLTVSQLITMAGGLQEFADKKNIMMLSATLKAKDGSQLAYKINYEDITKGKNLAKNNIELRPGDQIIVR